jgi:hypothetical protein
MPRTATQFSLIVRQLLNSLNFVHLSLAHGPPPGRTARAATSINQRIYLSNGFLLEPHGVRQRCPRLSVSLTPSCNSRKDRRQRKRVSFATARVFNSSYSCCHLCRPLGFFLPRTSELLVEGITYSSIPARGRARGRGIRTQYLCATRPRE